MLIILLLFAIYALVLFGTITNREFNKRDYCILSVIFVFVMCDLSTKFIPGSYSLSNIYDTYSNAKWDLVRYYIEIDEFQGANWMYVLAQMIKTAEPLRVGLFYCLSFFEEHYWISVLSVLMSLGTLFKLMDILRFQIFKRKSIEIRYVFICALLCFSAIDFIDMINTCRAVISSSLFVVGLYLLIYGVKRVSKICSCFLFITAALLHTAFWGMLIVVVLGYVFSSTKYLKYIAIFWQFAVKLIGGVLSIIPIRVIQSFATRVLDNEMSYSFSLNQTVYYLAILIAGIALLIFVNNIKFEEFLGDRQKNILTLLLCLWIGSFGTTLSTRLYFVIGLLSPVLLLPCFESKIEGTDITYNKRAISVYIVCSLFLFIYHIMVYRIIIDVSGATWNF